MKRTRPAYLRVVGLDERATRSSLPYDVNPMRLDRMTPAKLFWLEQRLLLSPISTFCLIEDVLGIERAFAFLDKLAGQGLVIRDVTKSGRPVYRVRSFVTIPDIIRIIKRASIELGAEMLGQPAPRATKKRRKQPDDYHGLSEDDLPAPMEEQLWVLIFLPLDLYRQRRTAAIEALRLATHTDERYRKARN